MKVSEQTEEVAGAYNVVAQRITNYRSTSLNGGHKTKTFSRGFTIAALQSKRPVVETSQSHNVPSQNVPP